MNVSNPAFFGGSEGIMYADHAGPFYVEDQLGDGVEEIDFHFHGGMFIGYRDSASKITYFRTVYSPDMLKRERKEFKEEWELPISVLTALFKQG